MDAIQSVALAGGVAWASGLRLYAVLFLAGLLGRLGYLELPVALQVLESHWVIGVTGMLLLIEFLADKIPFIDSLWDGFQTFIRIPAGALLGALAMGEHPPALMLTAGLLGGSITAATHLAKAGGRALINTSPEPFSNAVASLGEDVLVVGGLYTAINHPILFLGILGVFVIVLIWLLPKLIGGVRSLLERFFRRSHE